MSARIEEYDQGVVWGTTWHNDPKYLQQDYPVQVTQAQQVLDIPLEKKQLSLIDEEVGVIPVDSWAITRPDHKAILVPSVGSKFHVIGHDDMFKAVDEGLLQHYPDLQIESVGTLRNGATAFVNLKADNINVKGDESENMCRMMFANPLGQGCYTVGVHNVRIVCQNTLTAAEAQAAARKTLKRIRHTSGASTRITDALVDMAKVKLGLEAFESHMNLLADEEATTERVAKFMEMYIPIPQEAEGRGLTILQNKRNRIVEQFESDQSLSSRTSRSLYGLLQSVTYCLDHVPEGSKKDPMYVAWDGINGLRAEQKTKALNMINSLAA